MSTSAEHEKSPGFWRGPWARRTWREFGYLCLALLIAPVALTYAVFTVSFTAGVLVTIVGLFVSGALVVGGRGWGALYRSLARSMLRVDVAAPTPYVRARGFWRLLWSCLGDIAGWRALAFGVVTFPLAIVSWVVSVTFLAVGAGGVTYGIWYRWLPLQQAADGTWHRGARFGNDWFADTAPRLVLVAAGGLVVLFVWPAVTRLFARLFGRLTALLLGPTRVSARVEHLERARERTLDDADATLRRIERDLHDGAQARLVAVAMHLGEAKEHLAAGGDSQEALDMLDSAHATTKETLVELRELARRVHPPALDNGLPVALGTLAARSPLPVRLDIDPGLRLAPAIETIVYFCVAELVTNAVKYAEASSVDVLVEDRDGTVRVQVSDDGRGGAGVVRDLTGRRSGLSGLAERVDAVDGKFAVASPAGGPTIVTALLPARLPGPA